MLFPNFLIVFYDYCSVGSVFTCYILHSLANTIHVFIFGSSLCFLRFFLLTSPVFFFLSIIPLSRLPFFTLLYSQIFVSFSFYFNIFPLFLFFSFFSFFLPSSSSAVYLFSLSTYSPLFLSAQLTSFSLSSLYLFALFFSKQRSASGERDSRNPHTTHCRQHQGPKLN
jgi:hypothetical protein